MLNVVVYAYPYVGDRLHCPVTGILFVVNLNELFVNSASRGLNTAHKHEHTYTYIHTFTQAQELTAANCVVHRT